MVARKGKERWIKAVGEAVGQLLYVHSTHKRSKATWIVLAHDLDLRNYGHLEEEMICHPNTNLFLPLHIFLLAPQKSKKSFA